MVSVLTHLFQGAFPHLLHWLATLSPISALPFSLHLLLKFIIKVIMDLSKYVYMFLLRMNTVGFFNMALHQISATVVYIYLKNIIDHWSSNINVYFFPHLHSYTLPHRISTWDHLQILSRFGLLQIIFSILGGFFCVNVQIKFYQFN